MPFPLALELHPLGADAPTPRHASDASVAHLAPAVHYDLYAVVQHKGEYEGGHYTAFVRHEGGCWLRKSDSDVKPVDEEEVLGAEAFLLFYTRAGEG